MNVLVTGSLGYIGSVMMPMLRSAGFDVAGLDAGFYAEPDHPEWKVTTKKDIRDVTEDDLRGFDAIVHLAAISNDPMGELNPSLTDEINARATVRLAEKAKAAGVKRFIFSSSCSMYGTTGGEKATEESQVQPLTAYAKSKVDAEQGLGKLADKNFSPVFLRNGTAYGHSPALRFDLVLNNLVGSALTTGRITILSDGTPWRPLVHVEDISHAAIAALQAPQDAIHNEAFNIGRPNGNYQVRTVAEAVHDVLPGCEITFGSDKPDPDKRDYLVTFDKVMAALPSFQPKWELKDAAQKIVDHFQDNPLKEEDFRGPRYIRLKRLKKLLEEKRLNDQLYWTE